MLLPSAASCIGFRKIKDENLTRLLTRSFSSCKVVMRERVRVRGRVVIRMSRREQDGIEAEALRQGR